MRLFFEDKAITGIMAIIPDRKILFDDEIQNYDFAPETSKKLKATMGYNAHRVFEHPVCVSDVAVFGINKLISESKITKDSIDALILVTETPDYIMPPTSNVIQGQLDLKEDIICLDINQGCAGFEVGLIQAFMLLNQDSINKVLLVNGEMLSRRVSIKDRNSYPLVGDAVTITIIEKKQDNGPIFANIRMDGKNCFAIQIPAGGLKNPSTDETRKNYKDDFGNWRNLENLVMKGDAVWRVVQKKVPPLMLDVLEFSGNQPDDIPYYMFHQPNKFMINKLADKLKIPRDRMPSNIVENFGNSSGATVPLNIAYNLGERLCRERMRLCMAGFGIGLVWSSVVMEVGPLEFCSMEEYPYNGHCNC